MDEDALLDEIAEELLLFEDDDDDGGGGAARAAASDGAPFECPASLGRTAWPVMTPDGREHATRLGLVAHLEALGILRPNRSSSGVPLRGVLVDPRTARHRAFEVLGLEVGDRVGEFARRLDEEPVRLHFASVGQAIRALRAAGFLRDARDSLDPWIASLGRRQGVLLPVEPIMDLWANGRLESALAHTPSSLRPTVRLLLPRTREALRAMWGRDATLTNRGRIVHMAEAMGAALGDHALGMVRAALDGETMP